MRDNVIGSLVFMVLFPQTNWAGSLVQSWVGVKPPLTESSCNHIALSSGRVTNVCCSPFFHSQCMSGALCLQGWRWVSLCDWCHMSGCLRGCAQSHGRSHHSDVNEWVCRQELGGCAAVNLVGESMCFPRKASIWPCRWENGFKKEMFVFIHVIQTTILYLCEKVGETSGFMGSDRNTASSSEFVGSACMALWGRVTSLSPLCLGGVQGTSLVQPARRGKWRKDRSLQPKHTTNYKGRKKIPHAHLTN